ncbi:alpha-tocopherol transfer protein [Scaptodrosophila lebanonensis]|uniref:Alpha-tocopherol transfer protein n=1 Tax=Drosophila lebanonensis TaxID=7225 RepID=A0A6J2THN6_DROLE|nr:alpha-tocopherol transfer protein [Scaptodrosophila lebanonensis]
MPSIRPLSPELQKVAIEQLNEVPDRIDDDIAALRTWIEQQPHLKARTDDQFLVTFLRGCKYSLEKAKAKIDRFYTLRTRYPDYFTGHNVNVDELIKIFRLGVIIYLPQPLKDNGPRVGIMRMAAYNPDEYNFSEINRAAQMMQQIVLNEDDEAIVNGVVHIMDLANIKAGHLLQMTPSLAKKLTVYQEEGVPLRPKGGHFINTPGGFDKVFNFVRPMLSEKQRNRMYMHGSNWNALFEQIPQKYLPIEYGGENGSIPEIIKSWEERILAMKDYYVEENNYGTDEKLRPGKPVDFENLFGLEGSFRKLNVD